MLKRKWDEEKARALYDQKLTDAEIAAQVGATASAVSYWRRRLELPANSKRQSPPELSASAAERPLTLPAVSGPAALSLELNGCAFSLRAPDLESAARIYEYAGQLLAELRAIPVPDLQKGGPPCGD